MRSRLIALVAAFALCAAPALAQQKPAKKKDAKRDMPGMAGMPGMGADTGKKKPGATTRPVSDEHAHHDGMEMPIPMPKGMVMMPGLMGLRPTPASFLPGAGVNPMSLPAAKPSTVVKLRDGDTLDLTAALVRRTVRGHAFTMYAFNGQVPGPMLRVPQNATIIVRFHNKLDLPSTIHWHGVRLDNRFDGVPGLTQDSVAPGGAFTYRVHFPDAGVYWYHPHVREDIEQALGLFGNMMVDAPEKDYYGPANREQALVFDDMMLNGDALVPYGKETPNFALMGRVGNVMLVNGEPRWMSRARKGEVVRFLLTNAASSRTFNVSFGGAPMKVVAGDVSRFEREEFVTSVPLAPAERYVVEVRFDKPGRYALVNSIQAINHFRGEFEPNHDTLGVVTVDAAPATPDYEKAFATLRSNAAVSKDIERYRKDFDRKPDKQLTLTVHTSALPLATVQFMTIDTAYFAPVEWVDGMPDMNWLSSGNEVTWVLRDDATGRENMDISWNVPRGSVVKLRIVNDPKSFHPMQHPIHLHGQRMLVVSRDGVATKNLVWKDTALIPVGSTVDLLIDASNPGRWMVHCHIAEHLQTGMMAVLTVD